MSDDSDAEDTCPWCILGKTGEARITGVPSSSSHSACTGSQRYGQLECKNQKVSEMRPPVDFKHFLVTSLFKQWLAEASIQERKLRLLPLGGRGQELPMVGVRTTSEMAHWRLRNLAWKSDSAQTCILQYGNHSSEG